VYQNSKGDNDSMNITDIPSPNWSSRDGAVTRWIIIHGTAGFTTAQQVGEYFSTTASQVSAHYVVGRDGVIVRCVAESNAAWSNGIISGPAGRGGDGVHHDAWWDDAPLWGGIPNPNPVTISIEHVKPHTDNSDTLTTAQRAASFALILDICKRNKIPMRNADRNGGITGHFSMDPVNRSRCPGPYPWNELWTFLKQGGTTVTPNKWQIADAAKEWQSTAHLFGGTAPRYDTGIAKVWMQRVYQGQRLGPPLTSEYDSTDWSGNPIKVQQFSNVRCEWRTNGSSCRFFGANGEIV
jgi:N-acetyl-anhydromuramyl-L-alanine amidase AmpD